MAESNDPFAGMMIQLVRIEMQITELMELDSTPQEKKVALDLVRFTLADVRELLTTLQRHWE
jgi:hypothetical protein